MNLLIAALATFGLAALISQYDGPDKMFARLRKRDKSKLTHCPVCLSVWLAIPISILAGIGLVEYIAIIGIVIIIERLT